MRTLVLTSVVAGALALGALPATIAPANALPANGLSAQPLPLASAEPSVTLVRGGCGIYHHRTFYGGCRRNFHRRFGVYRPLRFYGYHRGWHRRFY